MRSRWWLWGALTSVLVGGAALYAGEALGALNLILCNNHFALDAADYHCRSPLYFIYGAFALIAVGAGTILAFIVTRVVRRRSAGS
ncbi:MAG TPA: hypothetical protein VFF06_15990 [Polyangia bacterium]|nr:hypothetical protein [Polyangia bacterium]